MYVQIVFPVPFKKSFTYSVPTELEEYIQPGIRAVAQFGKRVTTGFIISHSSETDVKEKIKPIIDLLDDQPVFNQTDFEFYNWMADYYLSTIGEVLRLTVPQGSDVQSKKKYSSDREYATQLLSDEKNKNSLKAKLLKVFSDKEIASLKFLQKEVDKKNIYSQLRTLINKGVITEHEDTEAPKAKEKKVLFAKLIKPIDEVYDFIPSIESKSPKQVALLLRLLNIPEKEASLSELLKELNITKSSAESLVKKGILSVYYKAIERKHSISYQEELKNFELTPQQISVVDTVNQSVINPAFKVFLLHGVTGSGKTQVYIELIKTALSVGKSALLLVPEISLTPQMTARLYNIFRDEVTVMHSRMSPGERFDAWQKVLKRKSKIVIGARSALFAPLDNIGIIIVDEEHDHSYKQDDNPRYNGRDCAIMRAKFLNIPILLGSATPSVESMWNANQNKYTLLQLPERVDNAKLPLITLVNILDEKKQKRMENIFSKTLLEKINDRLLKKEGIIILQNRRGFSTQLYCIECGQIEVCDNCSVSLVYHINQNILKCHYCGFTKKIPPTCNHCGSHHLKYFGTGTERVEDELSFYFPNTNITRIDSDSVSKKGFLGEILNKFRNGEIDILVGTQIVSKGLDFSRVSLVGVISAETSLWMPDFRADERTFQLLTQVSGRAGRSTLSGEVLIQTQNHRHFVLKMVLENNYNGFYSKEIIDRKTHGYPPFVRICLIETKHKIEEHARGAIIDFYNELKIFDKRLKVSPPTTAVLARLKGEFRYQLIVKSSREIDPAGSLLRKAILESYANYNRKTRFRDVRIIFDIDPQSII
ncbi:MAG TPA: primosomal protein N' [Ignavibacteriaceae bacterium]|nr:primosomal protein N' [Ignavibacteriaceae bacterium]